MNRLLVIRHAEADGHDTSDPGLSERGARQAQALADRLALDDVSRVLCGPRLRARRTAQAIAERIGVIAEAVPYLDDRTPFPSADRWGDYPAHRREWLDDTPADERDEDGAGIAAAWQEVSGMLEADAPGTLVVVTHAFVVGGFVARALNAAPDAWMRLPIDNTGVTEFQRRANGEIAVLRVNDTAHLRDLQPDGAA
ncbi:histidine phosphatase family protein [Microbacterium sp. ARD32]|uniref:histidine phosphatase family protein n=1 Tax=Microbacterium sp. ARD32 TaxID=2962577 RepID=UPI002881823F|nr:histidine phosphatase family protein [Microbacterium sp. ARD32]MDT0157794.1 histidine phosphatase family protein [Microbacterium sp. ARD32]